LSFWLETRPANDAPDNAAWRRYSEDLESLAQAEERARAIIRCKVVTPDGVRIVWTPGARDEAPRQARIAATGTEATRGTVPERLRGGLDDG
jgi:hypothetical protein